MPLYVAGEGHSQDDDAQAGPSTPRAITLIDKEQGLRVGNQNKQINSLIDSLLPKVWVQIVSEPEELQYPRLRGSIVHYFLPIIDFFTFFLVGYFPIYDLSKRGKFTLLKSSENHEYGVLRVKQNPHMGFNAGNTLGGLSDNSLALTISRRVV